MHQTTTIATKVATFTSNYLPVNFSQTFCKKTMRYRYLQSLRKAGIAVSVCLFFCHIAGSIAAQTNCNPSPGSDGTSQYITTPIVIDGNMTDWSGYLSDPDNISYDGVNPNDLDGAISDIGRDITRVGFTEDLTYFYLYVEREGSTNNKVDILVYMDIDNDDMMELNEPVLHFDYSGSNGVVKLKIHNYIPASLPAGNSLTGNQDGSALQGTLDERIDLGTVGQGSPDGTAFETRILFSNLTRLDASGTTVIDQLQPAENVKFHLSAINGSPASVPGANSINDNFGGCLTAPLVNTTLPILFSFYSVSSQNGNAIIRWKVEAEVALSHYVVEKSMDGRNFTELAVIAGTGSNNSPASYSYTDKNPGDANIVYYRLRIVDIDNKFDYSAIKFIKAGAFQASAIPVIRTWPNPVQNELKVQVPADWLSKKITIEILNVAGQVITRKDISNSNLVEVINLNRLMTGLALVKVSCGKEVSFSKIISN